MRLVLLLEWERRGRVESNSMALTSLAPLVIKLSVDPLVGDAAPASIGSVVVIVAVVVPDEQEELVVRSWTDVFVLLLLLSLCIVEL